MHDSEIRKALKEQISTEVPGDPSALILDEFGIDGGRNRADLAVVNGQLKGFEIKSQFDTLRRLARQAEAYGTVFDTVTLVTTLSHLPAGRRVVPEWWGLAIVGRNSSGDLGIVQVRKEETNQKLEPYSLARLIWREEAIAILSARGLDRGFRTKPRRLLWERLACVLSIDELRETVRLALKLRHSSRAVDPRKLRDEKSLLAATS
jgi:hypothetical protein